MTKLIFAQGNPGKEYLTSRHNIGFLALDFFREQHKLPDFQLKPKFQAKISESVNSGEKIILAKPTTFYNLTGESALKLINFYKINLEDVLVIHDELALDFNTLRIRQNGSDGGNKGIKSLNSHIGLDYCRLRLGVHSQLADRVDASDFVLSKFTKTELETLQETILPKSSLIIEEFIETGLEPTSYNLKPTKPPVAPTAQ